MNGFQGSESNYFLVPVFICPGLQMCCLWTEMINFMQRKPKKFARKFDNVVNYSPSLLLMRMIYVTTTLVQTWRSFTSKEVKTIISWGMCRFSVIPMGRLSVLSTPVAGSMTSLTYETCSLSHCVFSTAFK